MPQTTDTRNPYLCIVIVSALSLGGLSGIVAITVLALRNTATPESLVSIASGCFAALSAFLTNVPRGSVGATGGQQDNAR